MPTTRGKRKSNGIDGDAQASDTKKKKRSGDVEKSTGLSVATQVSLSTRTTRSKTKNYEQQDGDFVFSKGPKPAKRVTKAVENDSIASTTMDTSKLTTLPLNDTMERVASDFRTPRSSKSTTLRQTQLDGSAPTLAQLAMEKTPVSRITSLPLPKTIEKNTIVRKAKAQPTIPVINPSSVRRSPRLQTGQQLVEDQGVKIPLRSVEETPILRKRIKEVRQAPKGNRRSSLGLRGRRASSLTNGYIAAAHPDVESQDFYKHIDAEMLEVPRLQQLLAWCGQRALEVKIRSKDPHVNAKAEARVIQEALHKDLVEKKISISWFSQANDGQQTVPKKPNPRNTENLRKIAQLEEELRRLNEEAGEWGNITSRYVEQVPVLKMDHDLKKVDGSLLRPGEQHTMKQLHDPELAEAVQSCINNSTAKLEYQTDSINDVLYKLEQFGQLARQEADETLVDTAMILEQRRAAIQAKAGTKDIPLQEVLRSISRLDR